MTRRAARFDATLVRTLLREQHPDLAGLDVRDVAGGWDNQLFRLGDELAVRLPRTERAPALLALEQTWLPQLAPQLPLPVPTPVRTGVPSESFPHRWTIVRWVAGEPADRAPIASPASADVLADFLRALHVPAPSDAPANPTRGVPLRGWPAIDEWLDLVADRPDGAAARQRWDAAVAAPEWDGPPVWLHGDLHPANVVTRDGALAGVVDFGELCAGDPATDLSAAWILLPDGSAPRFLDRYGDVDASTLTRARGWAVLRALNLIGIGRNGRLGRPGGKPTWEPAGYAALARALADPG